jgi:hypothetical protein
VFCGSQKFGAFVACKDCGKKPSTEREFAYSLVLTDRRFDPETLKQISADMKAGMPHPEVPKDQEDAIIAEVRANWAALAPLA